VKIHKAIPTIARIIPPTFSHFHATIRTASKTNDGIRCIRKAAIFCQNVCSVEKESKANRLTKRIASMHRILGIH
jgi:hypothetical protein